MNQKEQMLSESSHSRPHIDDYFLKMLDLVSSRSTCGRRSVGAIITSEKGHVLSTGYNGVPMGITHCIESPCQGRYDEPGNTSRCMAVHAEQNAIIQCSRLDRAVTMYVSNFPCFTCSKIIANTPIRRIVYREPYADHSGMGFLTDMGFRIVHVPRS